METSKQTQPVTLFEAIRTVTRAELAKVYTCLPAVVEHYDATQRRAQVTPLVQVRLPDGTLETLPKVAGVPVQFTFSTSRGGLRFDLQPGDTGLVQFTMRSIENWLARGGQSDPGDPRQFDLTDAVFLPGLAPFSTAETGNVQNSLVIDYDGASLRMNGGKVALGNENAELLDLFSQLLDAIEVGIVPTLMGPQQLSSVVDGTISEIKVLLNKIKGTL